MSSSVSREWNKSTALANYTLRAALVAIVAIACMAFADRANAAYNILDFQLTPSTTQAGGHPSTHYHVDPDANNADATGGDDLKKIVLDYPAGLLGNPEAANPKCVASGSGSTNKFNNDACPASSYIGSMSIQWREAGGFFASAPGSVYILTPATSGSAATIGFIVRPQGWRKVFLKTEVKGIVSVRTGTEADYGLTLTVDNIPRTLTSLLGLSKSITISDISVNINARAGGTSTASPNGPYFTFNPTRCTVATTRATITSYKNVVQTRNSSFTPTGCPAVPFTPTANVKPLNSTPGAATGVEATFTVPTADATIQHSHVKNIQTDLPDGTGLNLPAIGAVPALCTEANLNADSCPSGSKIGTVSAVVPFLPPTMTGDVYLLTRNSSITFGYVLRSPSGIKAPLKGSAAAVDVDSDGQADRVRAIAQTMPQVPWSSATIKFTSPLVNNPPSNCSPTNVTTTLFGWSGASSTQTNAWFGAGTNCAPDTTITSGPSGTVASTSVSFAFTSSIAGSTFQCQINGGTWQACTSPQMFTGLSQGSQTVCVRAVNGAQVDASPACRTFTVDTVAPVVTVTCSGLADSASRSCAWTVDDPSATVTCNLDGTALSPCPNPISVNGYGTHTLTFTASDPVGNTSTATQVISISMPLVVAITSPANNTTTSAPNINLTFTVNGSTTIPAGTVCSLTVNGAAVSQPTSTTAVVPLSMGSNALAVNCVNAFGPSNTAVVTVTRGNPPTVQITQPTSYPTGTSFNVAYLINGSTTFPAATTCTVNGAPSTNTQTNTVAKSVSGSVTVTVACSNPFGTGTANVFFPAPTVPLVVITSPVNNSVVSTSTVNVTYTVNGGSTIPSGTTCTVNGVSSTSTTSNTVAIVAGTNTITVTCANVFGTDSKSVVVNTSIPTPMIISPLNGTNTTASSINVVYTYNGSATIPSGVICTINGVQSTSTTSNTVPLLIGANTITLVCTSALGSSTHAVTVYRGSVPIVAIVSPTGGTSAQPGQTINVVYTVNGSTTMPPATTCTINGAPSTDPGNNPIVLPNPPSVTVVCTNAFGVSPAATITFISVPPPVVAITAPANNSWTSATSTNVRYTVDGSTTIPAGTTCTVNGAPSTSTQVNSVALNVGPNSISVQCTNAFGSSSPQTVNVNRDNTPPTISNIQLSQWLSPGPAVITYTASDNSGIAPNCTPPSGSTIQLVSGSNVITVTCTDLAGNSSSATLTLTIGAPSNFTVTITGGPPPSSSNTTPSFTYSSSIPVWQPYPCAPGTTCVQIVTQVVDFHCTMDGSTVGCGDSQYNSPPLQPGNHTFCVTGRYIPTGQLSNTACYNFSIVVTPPSPPVVTITSPVNGSSTTSASTNVVYTATASPGSSTPVCTVNGNPSTSATTNPVTLVPGPNTITVSCTNDAGVGSATATVTRTTTGFAPTFNQTFSDPRATETTSITLDFARPSDDEAIRRVNVLQDPRVAPNYPSFGAGSDHCNYGTLTYFNVSSCPTQARVGNASFSIEGYSGQIVGNVYSIFRAPTPYFGIDVSPATLGNPAGLSFQIIVRTDVVQVDPLCDPLIDYCESRLTFLLQDLPAGITSASITLGGIEGRTSSNGTPMDADLFRIFGDNSSCPITTTTTAQFLSYSTTSAAVTDNDTVSCPPQGPTISTPGNSGNIYTQASSYTLNYTVDPGTGSTPTCTFPSGTVVNLDPGINVFALTCTNEDGSDTATWTIRRDNTPPTLTITSPQNGAVIRRSTAALDYTASDNFGPPNCTPSPGPLATTEGVNTVTVVCTDQAGNVTTQSVTFTSDGTAPTVTGSCTPHTGTTNCTFSSSEAGTATCTLDSGPAGSCSSPHVITGLPLGTNHTLTVCVTDSVGNTGCTTIPIIHGDLQPGEISTFAPPSARTTDAASVIFESGPGGAECRMNDGAWSTCNSPWTLPLSSLTGPAEHTYEVRFPGTGAAPERGYIWVDDRPFSAVATAAAVPNTLATTAASANDAGAHPDVTANIEVIGRDDAETLNVTFPDGLMGSLSSVPVGDRCSAVDPDGIGPIQPQWKTGDCPASAQVGSLTGLLSTSIEGTVSVSGNLYLVDAAGIPSEYAAAVAVDIETVGTALGSIQAIGYLRITDNGRNVRFEATNVPRQTTGGARFHVRSGALTVKGDTGGAAAPLITNPHFCGTPNPNRANANKFYGTATSYQGGTTPTVVANYIVDNCAAQPFNPQVSSSFTSLTESSLTALTTSMTFGTDNSTLRQAVVRLPQFISPNLPSFGVSADQCPAGPLSGGGSVVTSSSAFGTAANTYNAFNPVNCPPQARAGTATIVSPLLPGPVTADVWLVNKSPIPNIGIYVDPSKYGNPQGVAIGLYGTTSTPQVDPTCDPLEGDCPTQIVAQFSSLPDVPVSSISLTMGGVTGRVSASAGNPSLSPYLLQIAGANDTSCVAAGQNLIAQLFPWSGTATQTRNQLIQPLGCNQ